MKILVVLDFPAIKDPDSPEADEVMDIITRDTTRIAEDNGAAACWVEDAYGDDDYESKFD